MSKPLINLESPEIVKHLSTFIDRSKKDKVDTDTLLCRALATHEFIMEAIDNGAIVLLLYPKEEPDNLLREVHFEYKPYSDWKTRITVNQSTKKSKSFLTKLLEFLDFS